MERFLPDQVPIWLQTMDVVLDAVAASSWPIAAGVVLFAFRKPITGLLTRVRRFNGFGGEAEFVAIEGAAQRAEHVSSAKLPAPDASSHAEMPAPDPIYNQLDESTMALLDQIVSGPIEHKLAWAIRMRSFSEINRIHETNYRMIFGSQIAALRYLNNVPDAKVEDFRSVFESAANHPDFSIIHDGRTFEQWGQFVLDTGYAELVPGSHPERVRITLLGQRFLTWMIEARAIDIKPG